MHTVPQIKDNLQQITYSIVVKRLFLHNLYCMSFCAAQNIWPPLYGMGLSNELLFITIGQEAVKL